MFLTGGENLLRTVGLMIGLNHIRATLVKDDDRDDHGILISTRSNLPWRWSSSSESVRFVWEGNYKMIIGQYSTASVLCSADRTYVVDIIIEDTSVAMKDDACGILTLPDSLGSSSALYIYLGADADSPVRNNAISVLKLCQYLHKPNLLQ